MPKSRQRKNHKQKVKSRNQMIKGMQKKYQAAMESEMQKYLDKLTGMTETQSMEELSGPVQ
jgi:DNA-binding ferritin-like protein (Dps family)